jgi:CheY-like chemotaxis protein
VAIDRDTTRGDSEAAFFDALDVPDLSAPAADGPLNGSAIEAISGSVTAAAAAVEAADEAGGYEPSVDGEDGRVTRLAYGRHLRVLLVESEERRAADFVRAADESVLDVRVDHVIDTDEALARLERASGALLRRPLPDVIVVSLPVEESHRLLELLQPDDRLEQMPILVLAEHTNPVAERRSFALGATAHLVTPRQDYERVALVHALPDFIPRARAVHAHLESHRR